MEAPAAEPDLLCRLLEFESRNKPRNPTPTWVRAIRWFCNILGLAMLIIVVVPQVPRCKNLEEVYICAICLFTALLVPFIGYMRTMGAVPDDQGRIRGEITSPYTRCEEHVGRLICMAVSLLGLYAIHIVAMRADAAGANGFLWTVAFGMMGVAAIVGHTVPWITVCCARGGGGREK